jgi:hypothetical protein
MRSANRGRTMPARDEASRARKAGRMWGRAEGFGICRSTASKTSPLNPLIEIKPNTAPPAFISTVKPESEPCSPQRWN